MKKLNKKGFTIVELVIVIAVIAILAAVMIPTFSGIVEKANKSAAQQQATALWKEAYALDLSDGNLDGYDGPNNVEANRITTVNNTAVTYTPTEATKFSCTVGDYTVSFNGTTWTFVEAPVQAPNVTPDADPELDDESGT